MLTLVPRVRETRGTRHPVSGVCFCGVPTGLDELIEDRDPALKRGANVGCAYGAA
jgi:hypothetical protein